MKIKVKISEKVYEVEVGDLRESPIMAIVDGETFEVWPESKTAYTAPVNRPNSTEAPPALKAAPKAAGTPATPPSGSSGMGANVVRAPIPGVITAILVKVGDEIKPGQELCKLEAMKMNNSIRSNRGGKIASISVAIGQQIKHNDPIMEYEQ